MPAIHHDPGARRFEAVVEGHRARLDYAPAPGRLVILHTEVPKAIGGRGLAGALVEAALAHARASGLLVEARCSYARAYLARHPEHAGLVAGGERG